MKEEEEPRATDCAFCMVAFSGFLPSDEDTANFNVEALLKQMVEVRLQGSESDKTFTCEGPLIGSSVTSGGDASITSHVSSTKSDGVGSPHDLPTLWYVIF